MASKQILDSHNLKVKGDGALRPFKRVAGGPRPYETVLEPLRDELVNVYNTVRQLKASNVDPAMQSKCDALMAEIAKDLQIIETLRLSRGKAEKGGRAVSEAEANRYVQEMVNYLRGASNLDEMGARLNGLFGQAGAKVQTAATDPIPTAVDTQLGELSNTLRDKIDALNTKKTREGLSPSDDVFLKQLQRLQTEVDAARNAKVQNTPEKIAQWTKQFRKLNGDAIAVDKENIGAFSAEVSNALPTDEMISTDALSARPSDLNVRPLSGKVAAARKWFAWISGAIVIGGATILGVTVAYPVAKPVVSTAWKGGKEAYYATKDIGLPSQVKDVVDKKLGEKTMANGETVYDNLDALETPQEIKDSEGTAEGRVLYKGQMATKLKSAYSAASDVDAALADLVIKNSKDIYEAIDLLDAISKLGALGKSTTRGFVEDSRVDAETKLIYLQVYSGILKNEEQSIIFNALLDSTKKVWGILDVLSWCTGDQSVFAAYDRTKKENKLYQGISPKESAQKYASYLTGLVAKKKFDPQMSVALGEVILVSEELPDVSFKEPSKESTISGEFVDDLIAKYRNAFNSPAVDTYKSLVKKDTMLAEVVFDWFRTYAQNHPKLTEKEANDVLRNVSLASAKYADGNPNTSPEEFTLKLRAQEAAKVDFKKEFVIK